MTTTIKIPQADLDAAYDGSYYTIAGAGGDLAEWVTGYEGLLAAAGVGKPTAWYTAKGRDVNAHAGEIPNPLDRFPDDVTFLLFPLTGLAVGPLALFKLRMGDRWFDDVIQNMRAG